MRSGRREDRRYAEAATVGDPDAAGPLLVDLAGSLDGSTNTPMQTRRSEGLFPARSRRRPVSGRRGLPVYLDGWIPRRT